MKKYILIIALSMLLVHSRCGNDPLSGTTSSENAKVIGEIVNDAGCHASNTIVRLIPDDYNPAIDKALPDSLIDTTGLDGKFGFPQAQDGVYNLEAVQITQRTRLLITGIKVFGDSVLVPTGTLKSPGAIKLFIPDTIDTSGAFAAINGTTIKTSFRNVIIDSNESFIVIDSVPEATIPEVYYHSVKKSRIISDTITVIANDTTEAEAFLFWVHYTTANSKLADNRIVTMSVANDGALWIAPFFSGLASLNNGAWNVYDKSNFLAPDVVSNITQSKKGKLFFCTEKGLLSFNGAAWKMLDTSNTDLPSNVFTSAVIDPEDNLWLGMDSAIAFFNDYDMTFLFYDSSKIGLTTGRIYDLAIDTNKNVWFSTENCVLMFDYTTWITYTKESSGIPDQVTRRVAVDKDNYKWFGHSLGVSRTDGKQWTLYDSGDSPILATVVQDIFVDKDNMIWIGTESGLTMFDGKQWKNYVGKRYAPLEKRRIQSIVEDTNGNIWVGTYDSGIIGFGSLLK